MSDDLKIRKAQIITNFGVGAIVEIGDRSLMAMDISKWPHRIESKENQLQKIPRLQKILGIKYIINPPSANSNFYSSRTDESKQLPYHMFPKWLVCKSCKSLRRYATYATMRWEDFKCLECKKDYTFLGPVRFIHAPIDGYLNDITWTKQLHLGSNNGCTSGQLFLKNIPGRGSGLNALEVSCKDCDAKKSVSQIQTQINIQRTQNSKGCMPWEEQITNPQIPIPDNDKKSHNSFQQRGSTSLYQPKIISALDLSGTAYEDQDDNSVTAILNDLNTEELKATIKTIKKYNESEAGILIKREIKDFVNKNNSDLEDSDQITEEDVESYIDNENEINEELPMVDLSEVSNDLMIDDEWKLLNENSHIVAKNYDGQKIKTSDKKLKKYISSVTKIRKLREVRVLTGYTRHFYPKLHNIDLGNPPKKYLPGIEVFGEGMFIQFNIDTLKKWKEANSKHFEKRLKTMIERQEGSPFLPYPSAEFVLVHTFSHLLIKQLCFDSGYGATSIKERIYVSDNKNMCGVLIYTADSDSEGSFGGLVRMCEEKRLTHSIKNMLQTAQWCSADPTCLNIGSPGTRGLNKSACHACTLISETSCSHMNALLDRGLIIGIPGKASLGFFEDFL